MQDAGAESGAELKRGSARCAQKGWRRERPKWAVGWPLQRRAEPSEGEGGRDCGV